MVKWQQTLVESWSKVCKDNQIKVAMQEENVVEGKLQFANVANNFIFQKVYNISCQ